MITPVTLSRAPSPSSQRGIALLTVLLLVVSITVVAGAMLASQKTAIRRSGLLLSQDKLLQSLDAGQQLAMIAIRADNELNDTDSLQDIWAQPLPPYMLANQSVTIEIRDEASRFNINNLYHNETVDSTALEVLQRLLTQLGLEPEIAIAILDWQDSDSEVYNDGGDEAVVYKQNNTPTNNADSAPANQPFVSIEQLQAVRGMDTDSLALLRPYITAVPYYLPINVNTASPELLGALAEGIDTEALRALTDRRPEQVLPSIDELWQLPALAEISDEQRQALTPLLAVDSQAFMALITATDSASSDATKQRFATVLMANIKSDSSIDTDSPNANNNTANNSNSNNNNTDDNNLDANAENGKEVKVISQRLWAFRPPF